MLPIIITCSKQIIILNRSQPFFGEIIESSSVSRHLSTISLKNFNLFKIAESVINFYLKFFFQKKIETGGSFLVEW